MADTEVGTDKATRMVETDENTYRFEFDESSSNWNPQPEYNIIYLRATQYHMNQLLLQRGHVILNDVLDALGFDRTTYGFIKGWLMKEGANIDFGIPEAVFCGELKNPWGPITVTLSTDGVIYDKIEETG
jgi:hypothetical protein